MRAAVNCPRCRLVVSGDFKRKGWLVTDWMLHGMTHCLHILGIESRMAAHSASGNLTGCSPAVHELSRINFTILRRASGFPLHVSDEHAEDGTRGRAVVPLWTECCESPAFHTALTARRRKSRPISPPGVAVTAAVAGWFSAAMETEGLPRGPLPEAYQSTRSGDHW
jgi:hypothetical protein